VCAFSNPRWFSSYVDTVKSVDSILAAANIRVASHTDALCIWQAEVERLLFEDPDPDTGFMLHPDLKWDQVVR
jgi:hypothetical protein